jgi:hypothetical protein
LACVVFDLGAWGRSLELFNQIDRTISKDFVFRDKEETIHRTTCPPPNPPSLAKGSARLLPNVEQQRLLAPALGTTTRQIRNIPRRSHRRRNLLCRLDLPQLNVSHTGLFVRLRNEIGGCCFALGADDCCLFLLFGFFDDEAGAFGFLLGDLLLFDGVGEFAAES